MEATTSTAPFQPPATSSVPPSAILRPTEAQLRWAQFHRDRVAHRVAERVARLWSHPASPTHVPGARADDGNTTDDSSETESQRRNGAPREPRRRKPKVSRGRRALLNVSQRSYEARRIAIAEHGFRCGDDDSSGSEDDFLDAIFSERTLRKKRRRRVNPDDKDRVRRFEAAFYAMMSSLSQQQQQLHEQQSEKIVATRIWTRPDGVAVNVSVDGREYSDWKLGLGMKQSSGSKLYSRVPSDATSFDRGASWLVHVPRKEKLSDSVRHHLTVMARRYLVEQNGDESKNSIVSVEEEDVRSLVDHFERRLEMGGPLEVGTDGDAMADLIARFEPQAHVVQVLSPTTADLIRQFEHQASDDDEVGFVERFVANIEAAVAANAHPHLVTADGKLHKPTFARLVQQYLTCQTISKVAVRPKMVASSSTVSSKVAALSKPFVGSTLNDEKECNDDMDEPIPSFVRIFIEQLERDDQVEQVLTSDGAVNRPVLERMVHRYLEETSHRCMRSEENWTPQESAIASSKETESTGFEEATSTKATLLGRIQNAGAILQNFRLRCDEAAPSLESKGDENVQAPPPTFGTKLTGSVSNKVSELFSSLNSKSSASDEAAYSAFRVVQDQKRLSFVVGMDDESSQSSYRILPAGIRRVVQGFRDRKLFSTHDDDSEHKQETEDIDRDVEEETEFDDNSSGILSSQDASQQQPGISRDTVQNLQTALMSSAAQHSDQSVIYADGSLISENDGVHTQTTASLMLSPTLITKRHQQAIRAVEHRKWDHVKYLLSANPWLAEMADVNTNQYVIHKLAFYGAGLLGMDHTTGEVISIRYPPSPEPLNVDLIQLFPSSVHKFDRDGNLPLHMAAASANFAMISLLGERFPGGASVRNEDGMLPLHLVIIACASPMASTFGSDIEAADIVRTVAAFFPGALGVVDNEGNLPIHTAASVLQGEVGAAVVNFLLDETERQIAGPLELRFRSRQKMEDIDEATFETETMVTRTDSFAQDDETTNCLLTRNEMGQTPLALAISSSPGWEVIEALTCTSAALQSLDTENNSALHVLLTERYQDPVAAMTVLRLVPQAATLRNDNGMLPIEIACMQMLPREVILALVLVDLPINLDRKHDDSTKDGFGASWCYLSCECDDFYVDIVEEVVDLCSFTQARALCLFQVDGKDMVLARATPKCKSALLRALRVVGRFEFVESAPVYSDNAGITVFNALDFGTSQDASSDGKRVQLRCFTVEDSFVQTTTPLSHFSPDASLFEEIVTFVVGDGDMDRGPLPDDGQPRYCISIERPDLTLSSVVRGMLGNLDCQNDVTVRSRYTVKVFSVLRSIAKSVQRLHSEGYIHGRLCLENCGKYSDAWKLADLLDAQAIGGVVATARLSTSSPPESVRLPQVNETTHIASFRTDLIARPSFDSWAFGKLTYEVLVGDALVEFDVSKDLEDDHDSLVRLCQWNEFNLQECRRQLEIAGVLEEGISLVLQCLQPDEDRLSMDEVLNHVLWSALRRQ